MATQAPSPAAETLDGLEQEAVASPRLSPMTRYYLRRLGLYIITLWGALTASFFFFRLLPGDPISGIITQLQSRGVYSSITQSEDMEKFYRKEFGLDGNLWDQYLNYFKRVLIHFDFGPSVLSYPTPATHLITRSIPWTLALIGSATLIAWVVGILIGTLVGWKRDSFISSWVTNFCLVFSNIPAYFIALVLIIFLSYRWRLLPPNGAYNAALQPGWDLHFIGSAIKYGTLPVIATAITGAAGWIIGTRALIVTLLGEDFLTYANAKGLTPRRILFRYVLRNAWLPQIAALGISMGFVVNGNVLIERLFRYPGVGNLLVDSVVIKDVNTAMAVVTVLIFMVLTINLIIDLILPIFDPRVKYGD
jgi:peptide/nickel transport system permease protein